MDRGAAQPFVAGAEILAGMHLGDTYDGRAV